MQFRAWLKKENHTGSERHECYEKQDIFDRTIPLISHLGILICMIRKLTNDSWQVDHLCIMILIQASDMDNSNQMIKCFLQNYVPQVEAHTLSISFF